MSLSKEEAFQFLEGPLGLSDAGRKLAQDRVAFLDDVIVAFHRHLPFQTISNMAVKPEERDVPTWEEVKEDMFRGRGGLCFSLNYFASELLRSLGFSVFLVYGQTDLQKYNVHSIVIVQGLIQPGDTFLVDVGLGYATLRSICLDFEKESPLYHDSFQPYKYVRIEDADSTCYRKFARVHNRIRNNDPRFFPVVVDGWAHVYHFTLEPQNVERLREMFATGIYRNITVTASRTLRAVHWVDGRAIAVRNEALLEEEDADEKNQGPEGGQLRRLRATPLETDAQILAEILRQFPQFDEEIVRRAIAIWRTL